MMRSLTSSFGSPISIFVVEVVILLVATRAFVATDVIDITRKQFDHLIDDTLEETDYLVIPKAKRTRLFNSVPRTNHVHEAILRQTRKPRMAKYDLAEVSRNLDFRHDLDVPFCRIFDNLPYFILRIGIRAVFAPDTVITDIPVPIRLRTNCTALGQLRMATNGKPPAVAVDEVPVKDIELVFGHAVEDSLYDGRPEEVSRLVQQHAAPPKLRCILNLHTRTSPVGTPELC